VLSGFLITGILLDTVKKPHYFRNFYARRALRIFPLYFLCVFIFARGAERIWMCLFLSNYHYAFILQHFWSMGIEEQFYLAWPLIVWVFRKRIWMIALILTALGVLFRYGELGSPYMDTFSRIYEPAVGGALCVLLRAKPHLSKYGSKALLLMVAFLTLLNVASSPWTWKLDPYVFVTLASCAAVTTAIHAQTRNRGLEWIGKYSYGIYVYHVILLFLFGDIGILLSFPVAFLSFHLFESPFLKLKKYFAYTTYTIPSHTIREQGQTS
jgi:peptidoglycan/LPS O-acetylase OafA/YrhL